MVTGLLRFQLHEGLRCLGTGLSCRPAVRTVETSLWALQAEETYIISRRSVGVVSFRAPQKLIRVLSFGEAIARNRGTDVAPVHTSGLCYRL